MAGWWDGPSKAPRPRITGLQSASPPLLQGPGEGRHRPCLTCGAVGDAPRLLEYESTQRFGQLQRRLRGLTASKGVAGHGWSAMIRNKHDSRSRKIRPLGASKRNSTGPRHRLGRANLPGRWPTDDPVRSLHQHGEIVSASSLHQMQHVRHGTPSLEHEQEEEHR
jgi:hypothetical protein